MRGRELPCYANDADQMFFTDLARQALKRVYELHDLRPLRLLYVGTPDTTGHSVRETQLDRKDETP